MLEPYVQGEGCDCVLLEKIEYKDASDTVTDDRAMEDGHVGSVPDVGLPATAIEIFSGDVIRLFSASAWKSQGNWVRRRFGTRWYTITLSRCRERRLRMFVRY